MQIMGSSKDSMTEFNLYILVETARIPVLCKKQQAKKIGSCHFFITPHGNWSHYYFLSQLAWLCSSSASQSCLAPLICVDLVVFVCNTKLLSGLWSTSCLICVEMMVSYYVIHKVLQCFNERLIFLSLPLPVFRLYSLFITPHCPSDLGLHPPHIFIAFVYSFILFVFPSSLLAYSPSISPPGDPKGSFKCSETSAVSWTKWLSRHISWCESQIHFSFFLFAVIQAFFDGIWTHSLAQFYFSLSLIAQVCT